MDITPADPRDQHIAQLRAALERAVPELAFAAGQLAADDEAQAERLLAAADHLTATLERTAPPQA
ncbi:hypothetical protein [Kitasatospora cheerisanensis]|uniref:Uncharacterized protein n=1 Tax=Kitasatospora cheerisanensis KCTC 2395 TaxID=1348663 RepID=A0A066YSZ3_9ACTN|nr:hypothetical protein [Kitasatospora cheerisanensis]KDN84362.1 hypothetical protein KCH_41530 [Kitasatospora cheerisanensis KCTC 2395]